MNGECRKTGFKAGFTVGKYSLLRVSGNCTSDERKHTSKVVKKTAKAVKPVSNQANTRFHPYFGNGTSN